MPCILFILCYRSWSMRSFFQWKWVFFIALSLVGTARFLHDSTLLANIPNNPITVVANGRLPIASANNIIYAEVEPGNSYIVRLNGDDFKIQRKTADEFVVSKVDAQKET